MKKRRFLPLILLLLLLIPAGIFLGRRLDSFFFHRLADSYFASSLENDALNLHFTLAHPEDYGITLQSASLPVYSREASRQSAQAAQRYLEQLSRIHPQRLSTEDRYTYDLLTSYLTLELQGTDFSYYEEPLSPSSGMQSELPLLLAEYTLRSKKDVEVYLSLLESAGAYLQGLSDYEAEKSRAGLFMPAQDAASVIAQCSAILDEASLSGGSHFLQTTFSDRLDALCAQGLITGQEQTRYLAENDRLLTTVLLPSYQKLADDLTLLSGSGSQDGGLCSLPDGRDYYAWLVARTTGSSLNMDAMYSLLQKTFQKKYDQMRQLLLSYRELSESQPDPALLTLSFPLTEPDAILTDLQSRMRQDFPSLDSLSSDPVNCTIKDVTPALEPYTSPAFYMTPPIDDLLHNTICINRSTTSEGIELYTTLAHEGYPGHLYQTVYSSLYAAQQKEQPVRELLFYGGYVEGWAYYTEQLSYEYAAQLLQNESADTAAGRPDAEALKAAGASQNSSASGQASSLLCSLISLQRDLQINLFSLLDISLHYYGASREDILHSLTSFGLNEETADRIYNYLRTDPAVYLKYYVGYLEMTALRERARATWGENFSLYNFHRFVLEAGPSDFKNLTRRLKNTSLHTFERFRHVDAFQL